MVNLFGKENEIFIVRQEIIRIHYDNAMMEVVVHHDFLVEPNLNQLVNRQLLYKQMKIY